MVCASIPFVTIFQDSQTLQFQMVNNLNTWFLCYSSPLNPEVKITYPVEFLQYIFHFMPYIETVEHWLQILPFFYIKGITSYYSVTILFYQGKDQPNQSAEQPVQGYGAKCLPCSISFKYFKVAKYSKLIKFCGIHLLIVRVFPLYKPVLINALCKQKYIHLVQFTYFQKMQICKHWL